MILNVDVFHCCRLAFPCCCAFSEYTTDGVRNESTRPPSDRRSSSTMDDTHRTNMRKVSGITTDIMSTYPADDLEMVRLANVEAAALNMVKVSVCVRRRIFDHTPCASSSQSHERRPTRKTTILTGMVRPSNRFWIPFSDSIESKASHG